MVAARPAAGLSRRLAGSRAGPRPPCRVMPWQEPQSWRTRRTSSFCRAASGSAARTGSALPAVEVVARQRISNSLLDKNDPFHFRMRPAVIFVTSGLVEAALPAFIGKQAFRLQSAFGRKNHRVTGPLLAIDPAHAVAGAQAHFRRPELVGLDTHLAGLLRRGRERKERQNHRRSFPEPPFAERDDSMLHDATLQLGGLDVAVRPQPDGLVEGDMVEAPAGIVGVDGDPEGHGLAGGQRGIAGQLAGEGYRIGVAGLGAFGCRPGLAAFHIALVA